MHFRHLQLLQWLLGETLDSLVEKSSDLSAASRTEAGEVHKHVNSSVFYSPSRSGISTLAGNGSIMWAGTYAVMVQRGQCNEPRTDDAPLADISSSNPTSFDKKGKTGYASQMHQLDNLEPLSYNLLKLFEPWPPLEYKLPPEKTKCLPLQAIRWVEHDPVEIFKSVKMCISKAIDKATADDYKFDNGLKSIGFIDKTETTIVWRESTGVPLYNVIV
ncbi:hypothetical protein Tco_1235858 [Tanacetum coccineum]